MAILSGFQSLTPSSAISCSESLSFTRFSPKVTLNFLRNSGKPTRFDSGGVRLDRPVFGKLFAVKKNSVMKKIAEEEPAYSNTDVTPRRSSNLEVKATSRKIRMSVLKMQRVIDQIRGRSYEETLMMLELMPYRACFPVLKLVNSAAANARHNMGLNEADLFVSKVEVYGGPTMKRSRPRAKGQSYPIRKRTCHITIVLKDRSVLL